MITQKTTKEIIADAIKEREDAGIDLVKNGKYLINLEDKWLCADDVKKEIKKLKVKGNSAYNNAIDEVLYLCNSQEQKQGVRGVAIVTPLSDASSVSCEHNTGEDVDSSEKTEKFSETTISGSADSKASPVQNLEYCKCKYDGNMSSHKFGYCGTCNKPKIKKCICKKPILYSAKFMNGICGRCGGAL